MWLPASLPISCFEVACFDCSAAIMQYGMFNGAGFQNTIIVIAKYYDRM